MSDDYVKGARRGIRHILSIISPGVGISNNALNLIGFCLSKLNAKLVERCKKESFSKKNSTGVMPVSVAQKAVKKILPGDISYFAEAAANMSITRFNAGFLSYVPKIKAVKRSRSQGKITQKRTLPEFVKGVGLISQMVQTDISMDKEAKNMVALVLQNLAKTLIEKCQQTGSERLISADIIRAVDGCMTATMAQHAINEGARNVFIFTNGSSKYKMEDFERLQKQNGLMKKRIKRN